MESNLRHRRPLFWDINENAIDKALRDSPDWVIPRIFQYGTLTDIRDVIDLYGAEKTKNILSQIKMKPLVRSMAFLFLNIDPDKRYVA
jgi:hypothetical protein